MKEEIKNIKCSQCGKIVYSCVPHFCNSDALINVLGVDFKSAKLAQKAIEEIKKDFGDLGCKK